MKYCKNCKNWMDEQCLYCTECGSLLDGTDGGYRTPGEDIAIDINYYECSVATVGNSGQSFEITLCKINEEDAQMDIYTKSHEGAKECRRTYTVDKSLIDDCYRLIDERQLRNWKNRDDCHGITGYKRVIKFRDGDSLTRVSTERMPDRGDTVFFEMKNLLCGAKEK